MAAAAGPMSLLSVGLGAVSSITAAQGQQSADNYRAAEMEQAAQYGQLQATQTGAKMTSDLAMTLGHIDAVSAATHNDPTSPSDVAARGMVENIGTEDKNIKVDSILAQAQMSESDAAYMRYAGSQAMMGGELSALGGVVKGIGGALGGGG